MTTTVYIPSEGVLARVLSLMAHGAIVRYVSDGIEFEELLGEEEYIVVAGDQ